MLEYLRENNTHPSPLVSISRQMCNHRHAIRRARLSEKVVHSDHLMTRTPLTTISNDKENVF